jgi:hypothetical protein
MLNLSEEHMFEPCCDGMECGMWFNTHGMEINSTIPHCSYSSSDSKSMQQALSQCAGLE